MNKHTALLAIVALGGPALGDVVADFNPPAWRGLPNSTAQGWDFIFGNTHTGDLPDDRVVTLRNPNELPTNIVPFTTNPAAPCVAFAYRQVVSQPNLSDAFLTLLPVADGQEPARLMLAIPNFESESGMLMRIQFTYRCPVAPELEVLHATGLVGQDVRIEGFSITDQVDPERGNWNRVTYDLQFNRTSGWQAVIFTNASGFNLDIESIVIDTIVPAPGVGVCGAAALGLAGVRCRRRG